MKSKSSCLYDLERTGPRRTAYNCWPHRKCRVDDDADVMIPLLRLLVRRMKRFGGGVGGVGVGEGGDRSQMVNASAGDAFDSQAFVFGWQHPHRSFLRSRSPSQQSCIALCGSHVMPVIFSSVLRVNGILSFCESLYILDPNFLGAVDGCPRDCSVEPCLSCVQPSLATNPYTCIIILDSGTADACSREVHRLEIHKANPRSKW